MPCRPIPSFDIVCVQCDPNMECVGSGKIGQ